MKTEWISDIADIIDTASDAGTPHRLIALLRTLIPFKYAICLINTLGERPIYICDTFEGHAAKAAVQRYCNGTYLINPVYNAFLSGLGPGVRRMRELAPDNWNNVSSVIEAYEAHKHPDEEIGYQTSGWPSGLEELVLTFSIGEKSLGEISLSNPTADGGFSDTDIKNLETMLPLIGAAMRRYWPHHPRMFENDHKKRLGPLLENFGKELLTSREAEVIQLILTGHSGHAISETLRISETTVKTHRQNAYAKLDVGNHQQLFARFLKWLDTLGMLA